MLICDAQAHAPDAPSNGRVPGISKDDLLREMDGSGVRRCIIVPLSAGGPDEGANNAASLELVQSDLSRFGLVKVVDTNTPRPHDFLEGWRSTPGLLGGRLGFVREPNVSRLQNRELEWLWTAAEEAQFPLAMLVTRDLLPRVAEIAIRHPGLRLTLDHLALTPFVHYDDIADAVEPVLKMSHHLNVSVKASVLPDSIDEEYPFPSLQEPVRRVISEFGGRRVFWGSDITRLLKKCTYDEWVRFARDDLRLDNESDREWLLGRGVQSWLNWEG